MAAPKIFTLVGSICFLLACATLQVSGQVGPGVRIDLPDVQFAGAPASPTLVSPAPNHVLQNASVTFVWQPGGGELAPTHYNLCVAEVDKHCNQPGAVHYTNIPTTTTSFAPSEGLPLRLQGKALHWTVFACAPGQLNLPGGEPVELCNRAPLRSLFWQLPAPELSRASGPISILRPNFVWRLVVGADSYLICVSKPGIACPSQAVNNTNTVVVATASTVYTPPPDRPLTQFAGQTVHWTAAACNATFGCVYQQQVKEITFPAIPPLPPAPILNSPAAGHVTTSRQQEFRWQAAAGAVSHKICVSPPGVQCGTSGSYESVPLGISTYLLELPQWLGPIGTELNWTVAACNSFNRCTYQQQVRSLVIGPLPQLSINPASANLAIGAGQNAEVRRGGATASALTVTLTPQNANVTINGQPAGASAAIVIPANAGGQGFTVQAIQAGTTTIHATANGYQSASMVVSIPAPAVRMSVTPMTAAVVWGEVAAYTVEVQSEHGFSGPVTLAVDQLPTGVSATLSASVVNLVPNGPAQNSILHLSTPFGTTRLGSFSFRVRATSSARTVTQPPVLVIKRMEGNFVQSASLASSQNCGANVRAIYQSVGLNDIRVTFEVDRPSGTVTTQAIPAVYYAMSQSPACRIGVVMHPCQNISCSGAGEPALSWYNLGWENSTGAPAIPQRIKNLTQINWHQFWFSADQSLLLLVTKQNQAVTCPPNCPHLDIRAFVYDAITGDRLGQVDLRTQATGNPSNPVANITAARLTGNEVVIDFVRETGNAGSRTVTIP